MLAKKMSKSLGNIVLPDEVVNRVYKLDERYEFRFVNGAPLNPIKFGVWRDKLNTGFFFTATKFGRTPVFLHEKGNLEPIMLIIKGKAEKQHCPGGGIGIR